MIIKKITLKPSYNLLSPREKISLLTTQAKMSQKIPSEQIPSCICVDDDIYLEYKNTLSEYRILKEKHVHLLQEIEARKLYAEQKENLSDSFWISYYSKKQEMAVISKLLSELEKELNRQEDVLLSILDAS